MAAIVTDKPLKLIAELNKTYLTAKKNAGPQLWTEIASKLRQAAEQGIDKVMVTVDDMYAEFIDSRLASAEIVATKQGKSWELSGWSKWVDVEAEKKAADEAASKLAGEQAQ